jgi:hypothetical protein
MLVDVIFQMINILLSIINGSLIGVQVLPKRCLVYQTTYNAAFDAAFTQHSLRGAQFFAEICQQSYRKPGRYRVEEEQLAATVSWSAYALYKVAYMLVRGAASWRSLFDCYDESLQTKIVWVIAQLAVELLNPLFLMFWQLYRSVGDVTSEVNYDICNAITVGDHVNVYASFPKDSRWLVDCGALLDTTDPMNLVMIAIGINIAITLVKDTIAGHIAETLSARGRPQIAPIIQRAKAEEAALETEIQQQVLNHNVNAIPPEDEQAAIVYGASERAGSRRR